MKKKQFGRLRVGDRIVHPMVGTRTVKEVESAYDFSTRPPTPYTYSITVEDGRRMKIIDKRDVTLLYLWFPAKECAGEGLV